MKGKAGLNAKERARVKRVLGALGELYPDTTTALDHKSAFELLVATVLSAQCTDVRVNKVTPELFRAYPTAAKMAKAKQTKVEELIRTTGFFRSKAQSIISLSKALDQDHGGEVPGEMEALTALAGVGRKTANVVLGTWFGVPALPVDTHVKRLSNRLGLTQNSDPTKIEHDLMALCPKEEWTFLSHALIWHGRKVCKARTPQCDICTLEPDCPASQRPAPKG